MFPTLRGHLAPSFFLLPVIFAIAAFAHAASIRGTVADASGARVSGAVVVLMQNGQAVATTVSTADGSFQILTGSTGRFFLITSAKSFRQLETPVFYAAALDNVERNIVLQPEWVRQSIVVTPTGTPTPQPQTSPATDVIGPEDLDLRTTLAANLRLMPGTAVVTTGQRGAQTSLFIRGGNSDDNKVLIDGIDAGDLGNRFDFGELPTTAIESAEVYRGANSSLYGADASTGIINITTPRGTTSFPSVMLRADGGNFDTHREQASISGAYNKLDYLGAYDWFQTANDLPNDEYHIASSAANLGWQHSANTQIRGTAHWNVASTGVPNAWDFYHVADSATQKDQDLYVSASIENQTTPNWHNAARYGATRKREQYSQWQPQGTLLTYDMFGDQAYFGNLVTVKGANGASATGQAILDYPGQYPFQYQLVSNRDSLRFQSDYRITPHLQALIGFQFADERGAEYIPSFSTNDQTGRTNYDYLAAVHGDFKSRFFYTLGGSLQHYSLFGTETSPRAGFTVYALRPRKGVFSGTRVVFNYGDAVREPTLTDEFSSLYHFLATNGYATDAAQLHVSPLSAPTSRTYEGGVEQSFLSEHILFSARYFHNQFGKQLESVGARLLPSLIPGLTPEEQQQLINDLGYYYTYDYGLIVNSGAFRAQGIETKLEGGIGRNLFLRGGYTWIDAVVQHSFDSDNEALTGGYAPMYNGIPIGAYTPLVGARPFRRPPHTGFINASYSRPRFSTFFNAAFASRSDDSTYLAYSDQNGGNSLLLPNRNLDYGFAKLDVGENFEITSWLSFYTIAENLTNSQHIAPIGYESLPFSVRSGLRLNWAARHR
jgi:iron complex outermembrane receptor protein/vitamin B12 transporter